MNSVPPVRIRSLNSAEASTHGRYVLYWMVASRRLNWNYGLQYAVQMANQQNQPLVILEAVRCDYQWSSARMHRVFIQGICDNRQAALEAGVRYYGYLEPGKGKGSGLLKALAQDASIVVTDDYPCLFVPHMQQAAAEQLDIPLVAVDSNGIVPLRLAEKAFARAFDFRRFFQKHVKSCLAENPVANPLDALQNNTKVHLSSDITNKWPEVDTTQPDSINLHTFPFQEDVEPVSFVGGPVAAQQALKTFLKSRLQRYSEGRRDLDQPSTSGFSPYLRFGHLSSHQVVQAVLDAEGWEPTQIKEKVTGSADGFLGLSENAESFLDELITWREVGYNRCAFEPDFDQYETLPDWARKTLQEHQDDPRPAVYSLEEFERAETDDPLWNAAQNQLRQEGVIHNYMRMVWGKKILHWSQSPQEALRIMIHLNNKYAIDGRDPNSYSGIFWVLGRYDRAWGPERPVFGKIRFMSMDSTRSKLKVDNYIKRYAAWKPAMSGQ